MILTLKCDMDFPGYYGACLEWFIVELIVVVGVLLPSAADGAGCDVAL